MKPLSIEEISQLEELLASVPEPAVPMEADELDGFLTAIALMENPPAAEDWLPWILDRRDGTGRVSLPRSARNRLENLVLRRGAELEAAIVSENPVDPIIFEDDDDDAGQPDDKTGISTLTPFSNGFEEALSLFPELAGNGNNAVKAALVGILRYADDKDEVTLALEAEIPFLSLEQALADLQACVQEIARVTRREDIHRKQRRRHWQKPDPSGQLPHG